MKKHLLLFILFAFILPLLVYVITGLLGKVYPFLISPKIRYSVIIILEFYSVACFGLYILKRNNLTKYLFFLIVVISLLIEVIVTPLRGYTFSFIPGGGGTKLCAVVTFILYFFFIQLMLKKHASNLKPQWILIACLLGSSILQVPLRLLVPNTLGTLLDWLFHLFGIFMGYFFYTSGKPVIKSGIVVISIFSCGFLYVKGYDFWRHKLSFGTFTGIVHAQSEVPVFQFTDRDGNTITKNDFTGKYTVLDFWTTSCGVCFREFPEFDKQYLKYSSNRNVAIYAVNVKLAQDNEGVSFEIISERGYSFATLQGGQSEDAKDIFGVYVYPTVIVLNKTGSIVFRGSSEKAFSFLEKELKRSTL